ncbi:MAG: Gfo/Idh/MocA family protein [Chloroflexota bacterium]
MERTFGWGIIGAGVIAPSHAKAVQANAPRARLVGVCDVIAEKAEKLKGEYGAEFATASMAELLARPDIDCVSICVPSGEHGDATIAAARAGKNILCEKPLDITREKMDQVLAVVREAGVKLGCVFQSRTSPLNRQLKRMIADGEFGRVLYADLSGKDYRSPDYYQTADWRGTIRYDRGCLMNQGIHSLDLFLWLVGQPVVEVSAFWDHLTRDIEAEDTIVGSLRFANGALGSVLYATSSSRAGLPRNIGIHCSDGNVLLAGRKPTIERRGEELNLEGGTDLGASGQLAPVQGHNQHVRDLIQAIDDDREPEIPGWSARTAVDVALALYHASDSRSVVRLPQG